MSKVSSGNDKFERCMCFTVIISNAFLYSLISLIGSPHGEGQLDYVPKLYLSSSLQRTYEVCWNFLMLTTEWFMPNFYKFTCRNTSYAMLSSGIPWNIPLVTWFFFVYTKGLCVYKEKSSHEWDISRYTTRKHCITNLSHVTHWINTKRQSLML